MMRVGVHSFFYFLSSSALLVLNKVAITAVPNASALLLIQISSTTLIVSVVGSVISRKINFAPSFTVVKAYTSVAVVFLATIYSNFRLIHAIGVNPFIVLRCTTPLIVSTFDWVFLGRELPKGRSLLALMGILVSGAAYAWPKVFSKADTSNASDFEGMFWCSCWLVSFTLDMVYIKHVVDAHECNGLERTLYQNGLSLLFLMVLNFSPLETTNAFENIGTKSFKVHTALLLSCVAGTVLSFTGMTLRSELSATVFTVLGIVCKMASSLLNELLVEPEKSLHSSLCIVSAILCSSLYQQSPLRTVKCPTASPPMYNQLVP